MEEVKEEENHEEEEEEDDEDLDDSDYRFFLAHLTLDASGNSYILHIDPNIHIRYEVAIAAAEEDDEFSFFSSSSQSLSCNVLKILNWIE